MPRTPPRPARKPAESMPGVGAVVLELRRARSYTLDELAQRSGISKSMLSQIERDRTNPTVATLWRIARALDVGIDRILAPPRHADAMTLVPGHGTPAFASPDGRMHWKILAPVELAGRFEWYELRAEPHSRTVSEAHEIGATEHVTVLEGELVVASGEQVRTVAGGSTARYRADVRHAIRNDTDHPAIAMVVVTRVG